MYLISANKSVLFKKKNNNNKINKNCTKTVLKFLLKRSKRFSQN